MISLFNFFRIIALLEGISYILLLFIATPIKYITGQEMYVKLLGMPHGVLFMAYILIAYLIKDDLKWNTNTFIKVLVASVIPFGTFYIDKKYLKK